ncbi:hypothetical protein JTE90_004180 [Oedothorax gibbosus]|uniref:HAT C-terminal dimerisation domain-containing protein n=1 Tax=Oedothorax gibbosus TaxID=931172 RepID=A0AAV6TV21_9ARAC|nr:hypothetical protein JTE90_004180 [Oedothorax gibbosus]
MRKESSDNAIMRLCVKMKLLKFTDQEIDNIVREWQIYRIDEDIDEFCEGFIKIVDTEKNVVKYERLDSFYWAKVLKLNDKIFGAKKYDKLSRLIKACLSLSHGNADPERGFSVNKTIVSSERTSLSEKTIIGLRLVKDAVRRHGSNVLNVPITLHLLNYVTKSHSAFKEEKEREAAAAKEKAKKKRAQSESAQVKKKLKTDTEEKLKNLDNHIKSLKDELTADHSAQPRKDTGAPPAEGKFPSPVGGYEKNVPPVDRPGFGRFVKFNCRGGEYEAIGNIKERFPEATDAIVDKYVQDHLRYAPQREKRINGNEDDSQRSNQLKRKS